jgi:hypothetical protein
MAKKWVTLTTYSTFTSDDLQGSQVNRFSYPVADPRKIKTNLLQLISTGNTTGFRKALTEHFIYPDRGKEEECSYTGHHHKRTWATQKFLTRPVIEALFFEHIWLFQEVLSALLQSNQKELHDIFFNSLKSLPEIPAHIFIALDDMNKAKLRKEFKALSTINGVSQEFITALNDRLTDMSEAKDPLIILKDKLDLVQLMHSQDKEFAKMSNYKKICVNIVTILLAGCIPNLLNLFFTGNFLFFSKNSAQTRIANTDKILDKEQILSVNDQKIAAAQELQDQAGTTITPLSPSSPTFFMHPEGASYNAQSIYNQGLPLWTF